MTKSKDKKVQDFLENLHKDDTEKYSILIEAREIVMQNLHVDERMMYGGIMFSLAEDFGGLFVSKNHVSFEFSNGHSMKDPEKFLEGTGKKRRHLKLKGIEDVLDKDVLFFVKQIKKN